MESINIFWFRRDLRLHDNAGLYHALKHSKNVVPIFIFDKNILDKLEDKSDKRVNFIHEEIEKLAAKLKQAGTGLKVFYGKPIEVFKKLSKQYNIQKVYTNRDYEPYAKERDGAVETLLKVNNIEFHHFKDHVFFEWNEVLKDDETPYQVFTPYSRKWKAKSNDFYYSSYPTEKYYSSFKKEIETKIPSLTSMGFKFLEWDYFKKEVDTTIISNYHKTRDIPAIKGTSRLGIHLRFGTISIRQLADLAKDENEKYLNELIWRDFYQMIMSHYPHVVDGNFRKKYDAIPWRNDMESFELWCVGKTGYPMVDAGMRELNETGYMHNRVRMVVASFLTKHLLLNWQLGEAYFAEKLLDFELASNNGGWQWAAGTGCDAAPYFRVFNPESQMKKFDPKLEYIKKWIPEFEDIFKYPKPIVEHKFARQRAIDTYKKALANY